MFYNVRQKALHLRKEKKAQKSLKPFETLLLLYSIFCRPKCSQWLLYRHSCRLGKNELCELRGAQLFKRFSAKLVHSSGNFEPLNVQITNNLKTVTFIAYKCSKICKYYAYRAKKIGGKLRNPYFCHIFGMKMQFLCF